MKALDSGLNSDPIVDLGWEDRFLSVKLGAIGEKWKRKLKFKVKKHFLFYELQIMFYFVAYNFYPSMIEKIKESLSIQYLSILALQGGFSAKAPFTDYGVDLMIEEISSYQIGDRTRYFSSGRTLDIQLKSTTSERILENEAEIKFDLESKNFNDLIKRHPFQKKLSFRYIPLVLVVFVLPSDANQWLDFSNEKLSIQGKAFWYYPDTEESLTLNRFSKRISIPKDQRVDLDFFQNFFKLLNE